MPAAIRVENLGKQYRIGAFEGASRYRTIRDTVSDLARWPLRVLRGGFQKSAPPETIWALRDVSFEIQPGQAVGIIGRNGAGKSTLLKVLSRITEPTTGRVEVRGRVASLLEVGTGFHPELTGRENVFLNAAILGMPRREITRKFDEIVAFSEIEKFIDTPVKRYSSGMRMRLAFAVAAHLEPDILVIDEVLAVGDAAFQKKCLGRMESVASGGRTVLFVSHSMPSVRHLCTRGILMRDGQVAIHGSVDDAVSAYLSDASVSDEVQFDEPKDDRAGWIVRMSVCDAAGVKSTRVPHSAPFSVEIEYVVRQPIVADRLGVQLATVDGIEVMGSADVDSLEPLPETRGPGRYVARATFPGGVLNEGVYQYRVAIASLSTITDYRWGNHFEVYDDTDWGAVNSGGRRNGVVLLRLKWDETRLA